MNITYSPRRDGGIDIEGGRGSEETVFHGGLLAYKYGHGESPRGNSMSAIVSHLLTLSWNVLLQYEHCIPAVAGWASKIEEINFTIVLLLWVYTIQEPLTHRVILSRVLASWDLMFFRQVSPIQCQYVTDSLEWLSSFRTQGIHQINQMAYVSSSQPVSDSMRVIDYRERANLVSLYLHSF